MIALYLKELRSFLSSIIGYIFIAIFLITNSLFLWVFAGPSNILDGGTADLVTFFEMSPLIFCILIPAITMRSFAEENRTGTIELLFTRPLSDFSIILAKYLAGVTLVLISILPTLIYYLTIHQLGDPVGIADDGATIGSYIGLLMMGACFVAVGIFASSVTSSQIVAFILSMFIAWFLYAGLDLLAVYSQFGGLDLLLRNIGLREHYVSIQKGVLDMRDLIYFVIFIVFFVLLTYLRLRARKSSHPWFALFKMDHAVLRVRLAIIGLFLLAFISSFMVVRLDLTEDKRHSLSPNTIAFLQDEERVKDRIYFKIFLDGDLPADIMKIKNAIKEKMDEFNVYSNGKVQYEFIDPNGDPDPDFNLEMQRNLYKEGLRPCDIQIINSGNAELITIWPGALIEYKSKTVDQVQFFNKSIIFNNEDIRGLADQTINNLEYKIISAVRRVTADRKKVVGFLKGHGELSPWQTADVRAGLLRYYLVEDVEIAGQLAALNSLDALIIAQPKQAFSEKDKFVIDQFIMNGGRVLWFIDPITVNRDSLYMTGQTFGMSSNLNIEKDMIYKYGARLNSDIIIDRDCGPIYVPGHPLGIVDWYFYPLLQREEHPITKNIDPIKTEYASSVEIVNLNDKDVKKTVLLKSSYNSRIFKSPARINYSIIDVEPKFNDGNAGDYPVAVLLEGRFSSPFENRISDAFLTSADFQTKFKSDSTMMLVVSDGDLIRNEVDSSYNIYPISEDIFGAVNENGTPKYAYGNKDFVLNAIDYMLDEHSLIDVRTKTITLRMLDKDRVVEEREFWRFLNIAVPLILIILLGLSQMIIRRQKYAA